MTRRSLSAFSAGTECPADPYDGEHWVDTASGIDYTYTTVSDCWVEGGASELFPDNPAIDQIFNHDRQQWKWNGKGWAKPQVMRVEGDNAVIDQRLEVPSITLDGNDLATLLTNIFNALGLQGSAITALQTALGVTQTDVGTLQTDIGSVQSDVGALQTDIDGGTF